MHARGDDIVDCGSNHVGSREAAAKPPKQTQKESKHSATVFSSSEVSTLQQEKQSTYTRNTVT